MTVLRRLFLPLVALLLPATLAQEVHPDVVVVLNVTGGVTPGGEAWADSYSIGEKCYCKTTFDHNIGNYYVETPLGWLTTRQVCESLGDGPGNANRPVYNDLQCGNGPPNDAGDEHVCPGRTDIGTRGCGHIGPIWNFDELLLNESVIPPSMSVPPDAHPDIVAVLNVTGEIVPNMTMASSYSVSGECYCDSTFLETSIGDFYVNTPLGWMTVRGVCTLLGPGPDIEEQRVYYNDVQCGNGPPSATGDEHDCPGRVDIGEKGCGRIGPRWNFDTLQLPSSFPSMTESLTPSSIPVSTLPANSPTSLSATSGGTLSVTLSSLIILVTLVSAIPFALSV